MPQLLPLLRLNGHTKRTDHSAKESCKFKIAECGFILKSKQSIRLTSLFPRNPESFLCLLPHACSLMLLLRIRFRPTYDFCLRNLDSLFISFRLISSPIPGSGVNTRHTESTPLRAFFDSEFSDHSSPAVLIILGKIVHVDKSVDQFI